MFYLGAISTPDGWLASALGLVQAERITRATTPPASLTYHVTPALHKSGRSACLRKLGSAS